VDVPPPSLAVSAAKPPVGYHGAVCEFKRRLIEATLHQLGGNRTRTARALGLQRTYLLRLIREFEIRVPAPALPPGRAAAAPAAGSPGNGPGPPAGSAPVRAPQKR
jgi:hypothetical protein